MYSFTLQIQEIPGFYCISFILIENNLNLPVLLFLQSLVEHYSSFKTPVKSDLMAVFSGK